MKYTIVVEKIDTDRYHAFCPVIAHLRAEGASLDAVLAQMHRDVLCFLHDPEAELEIVVDNKEQNTNAGDSVSAL